jgi:hypothetical protein
MNKELHFGDVLCVLHAMPAGSVDLIYLDPPFNSNAAYNGAPRLWRICNRLLNHVWRARMSGFFFLFVVVGCVNDASLTPAGFQPPPPVPPFNSDPGSVSFPLTYQRTPAGAEIKSYQSLTPVLVQYINDPRLDPPYKGQPVARYNNWQFTAVKDKNPQGQLESTIYLTTWMETIWNPIRYDGYWMSDQSRNTIFKNGSQILLTYNDAGRTDEGGSHCEIAPGWLTDRPYKIDNSVFDAMTEITFEALSRQLYPCSFS